MSELPRRWVLASGNPGKCREIATILADTGLEIRPQSEFGITAVEETGLSYIENALIKARHASACSGLPAIADDSGLSVDALNGAPGILSARFAGPGASDDDNIDRLLAALADRPDAERGACFHCVIVGLRHDQDPAPLVAHGRWHGRIARERRGRGGFGYDPVFIDPRLGRSAAELSPAEKNAVSHRAAALKQFKDLLTGPP